MVLPAGANAAESGVAESRQFADTQKALTEIADEANRLQAESGGSLNLPVGVINNPTISVPAPLPAPATNRRPGTEETENRRSPGWLLEARDAAEAADESAEEEDSIDETVLEDTRDGQAQNEPKAETTTINSLDAYMADWLTDSEYRRLSDFNPEFSRSPTGQIDSNLGMGNLPSPTPGLTTSLTAVAGLPSSPRVTPPALIPPADNPFLSALETPTPPANSNPGFTPAPISSVTAGTLSAPTTTPITEPQRGTTPVSPLRPPAEPDYFPQLNRF